MIVDTGPLVAMLRADDRDHAWATRALAVPVLPLATCDAVMTEACFLAERVRVGGSRAVVALAEKNLIAPRFDLAAEVGAVARLMRRYADVPMSFADACLVRMTELHDDPTVITLDKDFTVYRRNGRNAIRVIAPWGE